MYAKLLDEGVYLASTSTMYRILRAEGEVTRAAPAGHPPAQGEARAAGHRAQRRVVLGHHQAARPGQVDLVLPVRDHRHLQPLCARLDAGPGRAGPPGRAVVGRHHRQPARHPRPADHPRRPGHLDGVQAGRVPAGRSGRHQEPQPAPLLQRQPLQREPSSRPSSTGPSSPTGSAPIEDAHGFCTRFFRWYNTSTATPGSGSTPPPTSTTAGPSRSAPSGPGCWRPPTPPTPSGSSASHQHRPSCQPQRGSTSPRRTCPAQRILDQPVSQKLTASASSCRPRRPRRLARPASVVCPGRAGHGGGSVLAGPA